MMGKKPGLALKISFGKPKHEMGGGMDSEGEDGGDADSYLDEAFDAVKSGDKEAFKLAMHGFMMCGSEGPEEE